MSLLNKILPNALCCFLHPRDIDDDETRPSTGHDAVPTIARKPVPYAMINVPHQPDIADEQAFRRMLTASPACPIDDGSTTNSQQRGIRKRKKEVSTQKTSFDAKSPLIRDSFASPCDKLPGSGQVKEKESKPRLDKKCSKARSWEVGYEHARVQVDDDTAATFAVVQPPGLVDILTPPNTSLADYDSDAQVIKTPEINNAGIVAKSPPNSGAEDKKDCDLMPISLVSNTRPSLMPVSTRTDSPPIRLTHSSPYHSTPEKVSFIDALQPIDSESPTMVLKRLSAGIANGSIRPPTDLELQIFRGPISHGAPDDCESSLDAPLRWSSLGKDADSPQTVIKRLSDVVHREEKETLNETHAQIEEESKRSSLLTQLEPALLGYLSRFSETISLDLSLHNDATTPDTVIKVDKPTAPDRVTEVREPTSSEIKSSDRSQHETASMTSLIPSEHNSVHLFQMNIPTRLQNQSNATIFSPAVSINGSRHSVDAPPTMPSVAKSSPIRHLRPPALGRAEHNRKPSDPQTRHIFEQPGQRYHPYWKSSTASLTQSKILSERDDASSIYSTDYGAPDKGEAPYLTSPLTVRKNINSLAVGGRSASTEIPERRSSRSYRCTLQVPGRSFSASGQGKGDHLNAAAEVISKYLDGKVDDERSKPSTRAAQEAATYQLQRSSNGTSAINRGVESSSPHLGDANRFGTVQLMPQQQCWSNECLNNQASAHVITKKLIDEEEHDTARASPLKESATDLWNRAYREARADSHARDLIPKGSFDDDNLCLSPSATSLQFPYRSRSSSILQTPRPALRRSQSVGPGTRTSSWDDTPVSKNNDGSRWVKTMKRLSFWNLKPPPEQEPLDCGPWKTRRSRADDVEERRSTTMSDIDRAVKLRAAHTPPLSHYLGLWGSFPSQGREERNRPASRKDNVLTRNFGAENVRDSALCTHPATLTSRLSLNTLSMMQNTSKKIFSGRSSRLGRNKTKSMSPISPKHGVEKSQGVLLKRWQRQYRTKSSEWRSHMTARGHRNSLSPGLPAEYPELEQVQGVGGFEHSQRRTSLFYGIDGTSFGSVVSPLDDHEFAVNVTKLTNAATQTSERQPERNKSSTWESITFANMSEEDFRTKENFNLSKLVEERLYSPMKKASIEADATWSRTSKDLKIPGGFEDD